jgi:hypothetical protein
MTILPLEVYATDSNYAVVKPPNRNYPGSVIQGDSLGILCRTAQRIAEQIKRASLHDEELLGDVEDLANTLIGRILHYQRVLDDHGINYPHVHAFSDNDFVELLSSDAGEE